MEATKDTITATELDNAFSALTIATRQLVITEIHKAILDTCVEYHKLESRDSQQTLWEEIQAMQVVRDSLKRVDEEYEQIIKTSPPNKLHEPFTEHQEASTPRIDGDSRREDPEG